MFRKLQNGSARFVSVLWLALAVLLSVSAQAQTYQVLHSFTDGGDGANPIAGLTMAGASTFYGITSQGGDRSNGGVIYRLAHAGSGWTVTPLYNLPGGYYGQYPLARVVIGPNNTLYSFAEGGYYDLGLVFNLTPPASACTAVICDWNNTILHRFQGGSDGGGPPEYGDLIFDQEGNIYGTTGGASGLAVGTVYELTPVNGGWTNNVLYEFPASNSPDGLQPEGGVIFDRAGNLYGTTLAGGAHDDGLVFQLTPSGSEWTETILYNFQGGSDGAYPIGGLIFDQAGNLYGTTSGNGGTGSVFELSPSQGGWTFTLIHDFTPVRGLAGPYAGVTMDAAGNLYGDTLGGAYGYGEVFKLTPDGNGSWTYTDLYDFFGAEDGSMPYGKVLVDNNGNLFGTADEGGAHGLGVIWEITP